jgi:cytochrome b561
MATVHRPMSRNTVNLLLDTAVFVGFLAATAPRLTGVAIHEWLGLAVGAAVITHLLFHWSWIVGVTRRFFGKVNWGSRLSYLLNALLFVAFTAIIFTGVMISEVAMPLFGVQFERDGLWTMLHRFASDASVFLIGLHVALHWRWIVSVARRLLSRVAPRRSPRSSGLVATISPEANK